MFLGIDVGQTVIKAGLYDTEGKEAALSSERIKTLNPRPGCYETSMDDLWIQTRKVIKDLTKQIDTRTIRAISFSGGGNGFYPLDEKLKPVCMGILGLDRRANYIIDRLKKTEAFELLFEKIGMPPWPGCVPVILRWFKENDKQNYNKIKYILSRKDFVRLKLTAKLATEISDACFGLLNVRAQSYDKEIFEILGVSEMFDALPELKDKSYDIVGYVTREAAEETGLKEGTPVAAGAHDACCNTLGVGAIKDNMVCTGGGTWSINLLVIDKPILSWKWSCESFVEKKKWMLQSASPTSTTSLDWFIEHFFEVEKKEAEKEGKNIYGVCDEGVKKVGTGMIFLPFLMGLPWGYPFQSNASAGFIGISKEDGKMQMLRAVYEGVAFIHAVHIEEYEKSIGISSIRFTGGAARSEVWCQMLADVLKKKIVTVDKEETGCFGAALLAALSVGEIKNVEESAKLVHVKKEYYPKGDYGKKYKIFKESCTSFGKIWNGLESLRDEKRVCK
jgi:L-xylulokinase